TPASAPEMDVVANRARQRQHAPEPVGARDEDRETACPVTVEVAGPPSADPVEVAADRDLLVARAVAAVRELLLRPREQRPQPRAGVGGPRATRGTAGEGDARRAAAP